MMNAAEIRAKIEEHVDKDNFSGAVLIKKGKEELFKSAYGYAHRGWKIENKVDTKFDTASITKLFTTAAIFDLIEKEKLTLEDRFLDIVDVGESTFSDEITIYHLLTHSSGIADDAEEEAGEDYEEIWKEKPNYMTRKLEDFLPNFAHKEPNFKPGEDSRYNNCGFILLGMVIEKLTGETYQDYVQKNVFDKIGMKNSTFISMDGINENAAEGYAAIENENEDVIGWRKNIYSYPPMGTPDGGAFTTVEDLDLFFRAIRNGDVFSDEITEEIMKPKILNEEGSYANHHRGYAFELFTDKNNEKVNRIEKDGCNPGVACVASYYPETDITVVILANHDCNVWELAWQLECGLMPKNEA